MEHNGHVKDDQMSNGRVLAIAGGASAVAGALVAGIGRARQQRHQPTRLEEVGAVIGQSGERGGRLARETAARAGVEAGKGADRAARAASAGTLISAVDGDRAKEAVAGAKDAAAARLGQARVRANVSSNEAAIALKHRVEDARARARDVHVGIPHVDADRSKKQAEALVDMASKSLKSARQNAAPAVERVRERAPVLAGVVAATAQDRINQVAEYAVDMADTARSRADRADLSGVTAHMRPAGDTVKETLNRLKEDVAPAARDAAVQAAAAAIQLWEATRDQTADLNTKDLQRASGNLFSELAGRAKEAAATTAAVAHETSDDIAERTDAARERAEELTRRAATATADTSKEATSTLVWAGIAGGLIYYGLLDEGQRRRVDSAARSIYSGVMELVRDIQGYDADF